MAVSCGECSNPSAAINRVCEGLPVPAEVTESSRLEKTLKITQSHHQSSDTWPAPQHYLGENELTGGWWALLLALCPGTSPGWSRDRAAGGATFGGPCPRAARPGPAARAPSAPGSPRRGPGGAAAARGAFPTAPELASAARQSRWREGGVDPPPPPPTAPAGSCGSAPWRRGAGGAAARLPEGLFPRSPVRGRAGPWGEPAPRRGKLLSRTARPLPGAGRERARLEALGLSPGGRSPWFWGGSGGGSVLGSALGCPGTLPAAWLAAGCRRLRLYPGMRVGIQLKWGEGEMWLSLNVPDQVTVRGIIL